MIHRRLRFSSDADIVRLTNARIIIIIIVAQRPSRSLTNSASILVGFLQNLQGSHHPHPHSALYFPMTNQRYKINMHTLWVIYEKALRETQTLRTVSSKAEPKIITPLQTPFSGGTKAITFALAPTGHIMWVTLYCVRLDAWHWPYVTDNSGITTYGLTVLEREMSTPIPSRGVAQFTFTDPLPKGAGISWRWSLPLPTNPVWWGSMHAILSYRGTRATYTQTHPPNHRQDRLQYTVPQLARSVTKCSTTE